MHATRRLIISLLMAMPFLAGLNASAAPASDEDFLTIYIVTTVPEGTPDVFITGNIKHFGPWWAEKEIMFKEGSLRIYKLEVPKNFRMEYKFTLGNWKHEATKENGRKFDNFKLKATENNQVFKHQVFGWTGDWEEIYKK